MSDMAIEVVDLEKRFSGFALSGLDLSVERGAVLGLIGANGAGKTTTIRILAGLIRRDGGMVRVLGQDPWMAGASFRESLGFVFDESHWYGSLSASETGAWLRRLYPRWDEGAFRSHLEDLVIDPDKRIDTLSKGQRSKFSLAVALSHGAELIVMDEPTSGLDPVSRSEVLDLLYEVIGKGGTSLLFSTHITADLERIADRVAFIREGRSVFCEELPEVLDRHVVVRGPVEALGPEVERLLVGYRRSGAGFEGLCDRAPALRAFDDRRLRLERASLEDIMVYSVREDYRVRVAS